LTRFSNSDVLECADSEPSFRMGIRNCVWCPRIPSPTIGVEVGAALRLPVGSVYAELLQGRHMANLGIDVGRKLSPLSPALEEWTRLIAEYRRRQPDDAPYWYGERASLSLLCAAIWRTDGIALEEYSAFKGDEALARGRADLWLKIGRFTITVEAKQCWPTVQSNGERAVACAEAALASACADASLVDRREAPFQAGLVFVVPELAAMRVAAFQPEVFADRLRRAVKHDFAAWAFYERSDWPVNPDSRTFPGILMLGRLARTDQR
jgi:hypothetical protein